MPEAIFRHNTGTLPYTASGAKAAGEVVLLPDGRAGVVKTDLADGELGSVYTTGLLDFVAASALTLTVGDAAYWDVSDNTVIASGSAVTGDFPIGPAVVAKLNGQTVVRVDLNAQPIA